MKQKYTKYSKPVEVYKQKYNPESLNTVIDNILNNTFTGADILNYFDKCNQLCSTIHDELFIYKDTVQKILNDNKKIVDYINNIIPTFC